MNPPASGDEDSPGEASDSDDERRVFENLTITSASEAGEGQTAVSVTSGTSDPAGGSWSGTGFRLGA